MVKTQQTFRNPVYFDPPNSALRYLSGKREVAFASVMMRDMLFQTATRMRQVLKAEDCYNSI